MSDDKKPTQQRMGRKTSTGRRASRVHPDPDTRRQLHSLQVHQAELEMQNKELRQAREDLDGSLSRYTALYEHAPVGFVTLGPDGIILELNHCAERLLGSKHRQWRRTRLDSHIAPASRNAFSALLTAALDMPAAQKDCEVELLRPNYDAVCVQVSAAYQAADGTYLVTLVDTTARRDALQRAREAEQLAQKLLCQNRHLTRRMFERLEDDRRRVTREIQKELGRRFASIYREMAAMIRTEHRLQAETRPHIRSITASLAEMQNGLRRIMLRLRPPLLDLAGIGESLREFVTQWQERHPRIRCELTVQGEFEGVPDAVNVALFRVVQGALANVANHSHASRVVVRLTRQNGILNLVIDDNGEGFDPVETAPGMGLLEMRERIAALDGQFELTTQPASGVRIEVYLPAAPPQARGDEIPGEGPPRPNA